MDENLKNLRSKINPKARIKYMEGHFATSNTHVNLYIDMSTIKSRFNNARETAYTICEHYKSNTMIDTIVCLDGMEVIGAFLAERLCDKTLMSLNSGKNISVITPESKINGNLIFMESTQRMIKNQTVLILADSVSSGNSVARAMEAITYYGGVVTGIASVFSAVDEVGSMPVYSIFKPEDLPNFFNLPAHQCPLCAKRVPLDAIITTFGYSKL